MTKKNILRPQKYITQSEWSRPTLFFILLSEKYILCNTNCSELFLCYELFEFEIVKNKEAFKMSA